MYLMFLCIPSDNGKDAICSVYSFLRMFVDVFNFRIYNFTKKIPWPLLKL